MKRTFAPRTYAKRDAQGRNIPFAEIAEETAKYLAETRWPPSGEDNQDHWQAPNYPNLSQAGMGINDGEITTEEVEQAIGSLKKGKTPGPDTLTVELIKLLGEENRQRLRDLMNKWWTEEHIPEEALRARVVMIFKKKETQISTKTTDPSASSTCSTKSSP